MRGCGLTEIAMAVYVSCGIAGAVVVEQAYAMQYGTWPTTNVFWGLVAGAFSISNLALALRVWVSGTMAREVDELTEAVTSTLGPPRLHLHHRLPRRLTTPRIHHQPQPTNCPRRTTCHMTTTQFPKPIPKASPTTTHSAS